MHMNNLIADNSTSAWLFIMTILTIILALKYFLDRSERKRVLDQNIYLVAQLKLLLESLKENKQISEETIFKIDRYIKVIEEPSKFQGTGSGLP